PSTNNKRLPAASARPMIRHRGKEILSGAKLLAPHKVSVTPTRTTPRSLLAIALESGPQVATREAQKHSRAARMGSLALQGVEDLFDGVGHRSGPDNIRAASGSGFPSSAN